MSPFADGWEMTEEQAIIILLDMLNGLIPPQNVKQKAFRTIILKWLERNNKNAADLPTQTKGRI